MICLRFGCADLKKIEQKITAQDYVKLSEFIGDMTKIFDNCRFYNAKESPFYRCAESLEGYFVQRIKHLRETLAATAEKTTPATAATEVGAKAAVQTTAAAVKGATAMDVQVEKKEAEEPEMDAEMNETVKQANATTTVVAGGTDESS